MIAAFLWAALVPSCVVVDPVANVAWDRDMVIGYRDRGDRIVYSDDPTPGLVQLVENERGRGLRVTCGVQR